MIFQICNSFRKKKKLQRNACKSEARQVKREHSLETEKLQSGSTTLTQTSPPEQTLRERGIGVYYTGSKDLCDIPMDYQGDLSSHILILKETCFKLIDVLFFF